MKRNIFLCFCILLGTFQLFAQQKQWQLEQSHFNVPSDGGQYGTLVFYTQPPLVGDEELICLGNLELITIMPDIQGQVDSVYFTSSRLNIVFKPNYTTQDILLGQVQVLFKDKMDNDNTSYRIIFTYSQEGLHSLFGGRVEGSDRIYELGEQPEKIQSVQPALAGTGTYSYSWERWDPEIGNWQTVEGQTGLELWPRPLVSCTEYYRRKVTSGSSKAYSNIVGVKTHFDGGTISLTKRDDKLVLKGVSRPNPYKLIMRWQASTDMEHWEYIDEDPQPDFEEVNPGLHGTVTPFAFGDITICLGLDSIIVDIPSETTYYRRELKVGDIEKGYSNIVYWREVEFPYIDQIAALDSAAEHTVVNRLYYDGLGRPMQTIAVAGATSGADIVKQTGYDAIGRPCRDYLPFAVDDNAGAYVAQAWISQEQFYRDKFNVGATNSIAPYSQIAYDGTPLDREAKNYMPDLNNSLGGRYSSNAYAFNAANEVRNLRVTSNGSLEALAYRPAATLFKTTTVDEDGHTVISYSDSYGHTILSRAVLSAGEYADTYYVYDDLGLLRWVVSPEGSAAIALLEDCAIDQDIASKYCYSYTYDSRGREIETRLPGRDVIYTVYDQRDRVVAVQDGNMREDNDWLFTLYDDLDRPVRQFIRSYTSSTESLRNLFSTSLYPAIITDAAGEDCLVVRYGGYSNRPDMSFESNDLVIQSQVDMMHLKGLKTEEVLAATDDSIGTVRVYYYDSHGRVIQLVEQNSLGGILRISYDYDYNGNILSSLQHYSHTGDGETVLCDQSYLQAFTYDNRGRLLSETAEFLTDNEQSQQAEVNYTYDDLGTLIEKKYDGGLNAFRESLSYNIQGWLTSKEVTSINDIGGGIIKGRSLADSLIGSITPIPVTIPVFSMDLHYYDPTKTTTTPSYSGNITEWEWQFAPGDDQNLYAFSYDGLSRLTDTRQYINGTASNQHVERQMQYDRNGNIKRLQRVRDGDYVGENYVISYDGNKIDKVCIPEPEIVLHSADYLAEMAYSYDANGNMTTNGVDNLDIAYNFLNLPQQISHGDTLMLEYTYLADGTKLAVMTAGGSGKLYVGSLVYDVERDPDSGDIESVSLESAAFGGGRFRVSHTSSGETYIPNYYITDHLGSTRVIIEDGEVIGEYNYYPYGGAWSTSTMIQNSDNRYTFSGKEDQTEFGAALLDFHARGFGSRIPVFMQQDPKLREYYSVSPYTYCFGNPVNYIDPDGQKGKAVIDKQTKTITIYAVYNYRLSRYGVTYAQTIKSLQMSIDFFNKKKGLKYEYNGEEYTIKFELSMQKGDAVIPYNSIVNNSYTITDLEKHPDTQERYADLQKQGKTMNGESPDWCNIYVDVSRMFSDTGAHEIGHTLGMFHDDTDGGIMASDAGSDLRTNDLTVQNISDMMKYLTIEYKKEKRSFFDKIIGLFSNNDRDEDK